MKGFFCAWRFLTVLPGPRQEELDPALLAGSMRYYPLVGLLIGGGGAALLVLLSVFLPPLPAVWAVVVYMFAISGGLHMDGLADSADGLFSARPRERALEIMRDSRIGVMGVLAVATLLGLKFSALASLPPEGAVRAVLLMPLAGRCAILLHMFHLPYARPEGGLATSFYGRSRGGAAGLALVFLFGGGWLVAGFAGLAVAASVTAGIAVFGRWCGARLGGATGDTLGAACELAETLTAVVCCTPQLQQLMRHW